jgi:hypothetical protein
MRADGFSGYRTVTVTVRFENFVTVSRSLTAERVLTTRAALMETAEKLLTPFFDDRENPRGRRLRLVGVRVEKTGPRERAGELAGNLAAAPGADLAESPATAPRVDIAVGSPVISCGSVIRPAAGCEHARCRDAPGR